MKTDYALISKLERRMSAKLMDPEFPFIHPVLVNRPVFGLSTVCVSVKLKLLAG